MVDTGYRVNVPFFGNVAKYSVAEMIKDHTASHAAQANWRQTDDVDNYNQGRPGPLRSMEKGLGESF